MKLLSSNVRSQKWSQIIDTTLAPSLIIPVFLETLGIRETKFKVTRKDKTTNRSGSLWNMLPHLLLVVPFCMLLHFRVVGPCRARVLASP